MTEPSRRDPSFEWRSNAAHHGAQTKMGRLGSYYEWILARFGGNLQQPIVDAGAGSGHFAAALLASGHDSVILLEGGTENLNVLNDRFSGNPAVSVVECDLTDCSHDLQRFTIGSVVMLDVIEHLPDDAAALRQFYNALPVGGLIYIKVPAHQWLYGPVDAASGHYRRYNRASLRHVLESAGFEIDSCQYMNLVGVVPYFIKSRVLKRSSNFSSTFSEAQLRRIDRTIPILRIIDRLLRAPVGLSVLAVGRRAE